MALAIQLPSQKEQTEFNLRCWEKMLADPDLATLNQRIETNRHGNIIMSPPPGSHHSDRQTAIVLLLARLSSTGQPRVEVPISTSDGIRAADVAWTSEKRFPEIYDARAYLFAPDICIEVVSPANSGREMAEKKDLYFDAGATEVWLCQIDGSLEFFTAENPSKKLPESSLFPNFPSLIESP